jgi:GTPase involved in cell partitioning and DNA repair
MVKKNTDGSFRITSLGVDVPDLETLRKVIRELNDFNGSVDYKQEAMVQEKADRNFDKWRKTHLRKLAHTLKDIDTKKRHIENGDTSVVISEEEVKTYKKADREWESLMDTTRGYGHLKAYRDNEDRWRVKLIKLYGSKEDKAALEK